MVYCGPPSKGCSNCRDRKIRCDQREPGCGQCEKRQQKCPGYRNMVDLMFRDESSNVIKKAQAKRQRRKAANSGTTTAAETSLHSPETDSALAGSSLSSSPTPLGLPKTPILPLTPTKLDTQPPSLSLLTSGLNALPTTQFEFCVETPEPQKHKALAKQSKQKRLPKPSNQTQQAQQTQQQTQQTQQTQEWLQEDENLLPSPETGSWPTTPMIARIYNLAPTWQERGTAYFFSRYVTVEENVLHQRFNFIYDVWQPGSPAAERQIDGVMASMTAVGLVGVSQLTNSTEVIDSARKSYGTALRLLNAALRNPDEIKKDTTMLSILILGVFEMIADPGLKTMKTWQEHVSGAVGLATLRGSGTLCRHPGLRMFNMLFQNVVISCMQRQVAMPPSLVRLQEEISAAATAEQEQEQRQRQQQTEQTENDDNGFHRGFSGADVSRPVYKVLQMRHDLQVTVFPDLDAILARLDDIEAEFERTVAGFPAARRYKVLRVTKPHKAVFRDICHVYPSTSTASVWNWLRTCRVMALESVLYAIQQHFPEGHLTRSGCEVPPRYVDAYHKAWKKLEHVSGAIVAGVPQHVGLLNPVHPYFDTLKTMTTATATTTTTLFGALSATVPLSTTEVREPPTPPAQSPASSTSASWSASSTSTPGPEDVAWDDVGPTLQNPTRARSVEEEAERFMLLASATNGIVWPLFCVGMGSTCSPALKSYVVDRLTAIYDETGLVQARTIANIVRNHEMSNSPWRKLAQRHANRMPPPPRPPVSPPVGPPALVVPHGHEILSALEPWTA